MNSHFPSPLCKLFALFLVIVLYQKSFSQAVERRIPLSGFTQDVIADSVLNATPLTLTTASVDNPSSTGNVLYSTGYGNGEVAYTHGGLPTSGNFISTANHGFQLAPYNVNNDLRLEGGDSGRLVFAAPYQINYDTLFILATGDFGSPGVLYTINFSDSTQSQSFFNALDWFCDTCTTYAIRNLSRINRTTGDIDATFTDSFALREYPVLLSPTDKAKTITSIDFQMGAGTFGVADIFGITGYSVTTLPVTLQYFNAKVQNGVAVLSWKTSQELNNKAYIIERANINTPNSFVKIGSINSTSSSLGSSYAFSNDPKVSGTYLYRLSQLDVDGRVKILGIRSLAFTSNKKWAVQDLGSQWKLISDASFTYRLVDLYGKVLKAGSASGTEIISKPSAHGIYQIQVTSNGVTSSEKVIK